MTPFPSFASLLPVLDRRGLCLPAFCSAGGQPDFVIGVLEACREMGNPAVMLIQHQRSHSYGFEEALSVMRSQGRRLGVEVIPFLDHCGDLAIIQQALDLGVRSIMFDGSHMPLDENIRLTRQAVEMARAAGALAEGELGTFNPEGSDVAEDLGQDALTRPDDAARFVRETGVDLLAPSVGNAHGLYTSQPKLRFSLIDDLSTRTGCRMSLHGGTGIPVADTLRAAAAGFRKLNVATQLHQAYGKALARHAPEIPWAVKPNYTWQQPLNEGRDAIRDAAKQLLIELRCTKLG